MILDHFPRVSLLLGDLSVIRLLSWSISKSLCCLSKRENFELSNLKISRGHLPALPSTMLRS
jgi:hypothetical protein